jgi:hypothetical protein
MTSPRLRSIVSALLFLAPTGHHAIAADTVGNPGDVIRLIFARGREHALTVLKTLDVHALDATHGVDVVAWFEEHRDALIEDVANASYTFVTETRDTCAYTLRQQSAPITLSMPTCMHTIHDEADAAELILHETAHHFGVTDEDFADRLALSVSGAWARAIVSYSVNLRTPVQFHSWDDVEIIRVEPDEADAHFSAVVLALRGYAGARQADKLGLSIQNEGYGETSDAGATLTNRYSLRLMEVGGSSDLTLCDICGHDLVANTSEFRLPLRVVVGDLSRGVQTKRWIVPLPYTPYYQRPGSPAPAPKELVVTYDVGQAAWSASIVTP